MNIAQKSLIIFDLDGTLCESKSNLDSEMAELLLNLLNKMQIAVITGGWFKQFEKQFLPFLKADHKLLERLLIFPTCAASFFSFKDGHWQNEYEEKLSEKEKEKIFSTFEKAFRETNYEHPKKVYGEIIEDRGSQISFSAFGQEAPIDVKKIWDPDGKKRLVIIDVMKKYAPEFEIRVGGSTTIDVTHKGIDKAYGVRKIEEVTKIPIKDMVFVGDKLQPGGNDYPARLTGVDWIEVGNVLETKKLIQEILKNGNL